MSVLRNLESRIAGLVEGTFSRAFRSEVRPVEIARKLAREMEDHKTLSLSRTYVPNEYRVYLSPRDRERFADFEDTLISELVGYLLEHARRERLVMMARPTIEFVTDERLGLGEFGIETRVVSHDHLPDESRDPADPHQEPPYRDEPAPRDAAPPARSPGRDEAFDLPPAPPPAQAGRTMVFSTADRVAEPLQERARSRRQTALLVHDGRRLVVGPEGVTLGRSRSADITIDDPNVSRTHAEIRPRGGSWVLTDLGSTNGSRVNGRTLNGPEVLKPGDDIELGTALLRFELE